MKKVLVFIISLLLVLAIGNGLWSAHEKRIREMNDQDNIEARKVAEGLVPIIEKFKIKKGKYPAALTDLVPNYTALLPQTKKTVYYETYQKGYQLYFNYLETGVIDNVDYYSSLDKKWHITENFDRPSDSYKKR